MSTITAFMIVKNEEHTLPVCLASLTGIVAELVVVDTGSTDGTPALLEALVGSDSFQKIQTLAIEFQGFGLARQQALNLVTTEWALWIDADESLSPLLRARLLDLIQTGHLNDRDGWEIRESNIVLGRQMKSRRLSGGHFLRLFRTGQGQLTDSLVHEGINLSSSKPLGRLDEPINHKTMPALRPYLRKVNLYTTLDVNQPGDKRFNPLHLLITGPHTFLKDYLVRGGFVDGWQGLLWCAVTGWYSLLRDWKRMRRDWLRAGPKS